MSTSQSFSSFHDLPKRVVPLSKPLLQARQYPKQSAETILFYSALLPPFLAKLCDLSFTHFARAVDK